LARVNQLVSTNNNGVSTNNNGVGAFYKAQRAKLNPKP
jgi:hypothetical protein